MTRTLRFATVLLLCAATVMCSDDKGPDTSKDAAADTSATDLGTSDDSGASDTGDTADEKPICPGDPGCPCKTNADCDIPKCIQTPQGSVCARKCVDSCPEGYSCKAGSGDTLSYCLPTWGLLCRPCESSKECEAAGVPKTW